MPTVRRLETQDCQHGDRGGRMRPWREKGSATSHEVKAERRGRRSAGHGRWARGEWRRVVAGAESRLDDLSVCGASTLFCKLRLGATCLQRRGDPRHAVEASSGPTHPSPWPLASRPRVAPRATRRHAYKIRPRGALRPRGVISGVGVRHALFPLRRHWALHLAVGCRLPDAIPCGKQSYRSHSRTVPPLAARNLLGEAS